jgi:4-hydroxythreonine-4-phosphate dehydrogenase
MNKKRIVIASGDPAGCGPYVTLKAIEKLSRSDIEFLVVGDWEIFSRLPLYRKLQSRINLVDSATGGIKRIRSGEPSRLSGRAAISYLDKALNLLAEKKINRLVTAPLSKEAVGLVERGFSGHTEYLAGHFRTRNFAMMMVSPRLKAVLATRHIRLGDVATSLRTADIAKLICLIYDSLKVQFKIRNPRIVFAAVNPHAGVDTFLGPEERKIVAAIRKSGKPVSGPYPADTLFCGRNLERFDLVICAYHDQAMIPFKLLSFHDGVNLTLGLPIIRTSPAHGVAYDLMRSRKRPLFSSMLAAVRLALELSL